MEQLESHFKVVFQPWDDSGGSFLNAPQFIHILFEFWTPGFEPQSTNSNTSISMRHRDSVAPDSPCFVYSFMDCINMRGTSGTEAAEEVPVFFSFPLSF